MPVIGQAYLAGATGLAPVIPLTYRGPMTIVLLLGQLFVAVGMFNFAAAIRRSGQLPAWAGFVLAISLGGIPLAWSMWRKA